MDATQTQVKFLEDLVALSSQVRLVLCQLALQNVVKFAYTHEQFTSEIPRHILAVIVSVYPSIGFQSERESWPAHQALEKDFTLQVKRDRFLLRKLIGLVLEDVL